MEYSNSFGMGAGKKVSAERSQEKYLKEPPSPRISPCAGESHEEQGEQDRAAVKGRGPWRPNHPPEVESERLAEVKSKEFCKK